MTFGTRIKAIRDHLELGQAEFAEKLGKAKSYISNIENDQRSPSIDVIELIVSEFQVDARWLFGQLERIDEAFISADRAPTTENLLRRMEQLESKVIPMKDRDPLLERVAGNAELREIIDMVKFYEGNTLREIRALIYGYVAGDRRGDSSRDAATASERDSAEEKHA